jgi:hypothetical protein
VGGGGGGCIDKIQKDRPKLSFRLERIVSHGVSALCLHKSFKKHCLFLKKFVPLQVYSYTVKAEPLPTTQREKRLTMRRPLWVCQPRG